MPSTLLRTRRPSVAMFAAATVLAAALIPGLASGAGAGAASTSRTFALSGTMEVGGPPSLTLPAGSTFTATIDPTTGVFEDGQLSIPTFDRGAVSGPQANITLTQVGSAVGVLDPTSGVSSMVVALDVTLDVPLLSATCELGPIATSSSSANPGGVPFSGSPLHGTVTASVSTVPAVIGVVGSSTCDPTQAAAINSTLGLPTSATSLSFTVVESTPAPAPEPVVPSYTG